MIDIENSAIIKEAKAAYAAAKAAGDTAGMVAAHDRANAYRQAQGGYVHIYEAGHGTNFTQVAVTAESGSGSGSNLLQVVSGAVTDAKNKITEVVEPKVQYMVLDSYNPDDYMQHYSASESSGNLDKYLGYGVIGLIFIAILSRVVSK